MWQFREPPNWRCEAPHTQKHTWNWRNWASTKFHCQPGDLIIFTITIKWCEWFPKTFSHHSTKNVDSKCMHYLKQCSWWCCLWNYCTIFVIDVMQKQQKPETWKWPTCMWSNLCRFQLLFLSFILYTQQLLFQSVVLKKGNIWNWCTPNQFCDCLCIFLKNYNTLVTSKICFL